MYRILLLSLILISCNNFPADLQAKKEKLTERVQVLVNKEKDITDSEDYQHLIIDYADLKNDLIAYTNESNSRGFQKNNDAIIKDIDGRLIRLKQALESITTSNAHSCNICGRTFSGDGYCESDEGFWKPCKYPYSTGICSAECGRRSVEQLNKAADNFINSNNNSCCKNCSIGHYRDGFCDRCGAASEERVNQSRSKAADCSICNGTGIEKPMGANTTGETGRICPACNGTGKQSY